MHVRRRLAAAACSLTLAGALTGIATSAHADTGADPTGSSDTFAAQLADVQAGLGDGSNISPQAQAALPLIDSEWSDSANAAIDGSQYTCGSTELFDWLGAQAGPADVMQNLAAYHIFDFAEFDAIYWETDATPQALGPNGEDTTLITNEFRDLKKFWDVDGSKVQLVAMKSDWLTDPAAMSKMIQFVYGVNQATGDYYAPIFIDWVNQMPGGASNPYFTFNLFALNGSSVGVPDKIIVGDGVPEAFDDLGLDMGVRLATAHEYGHIVQNKDGLRATTLTDPAEVSRRLELMADAEGSYFLTHALGEAINAKRVASSARASYDLGDCSFSSTTHHGTPLQREAANEWAAGLANAASPQAVKLTGVQFGQKFDQELPTLVAPDATS